MQHSHEYSLIGAMIDNKECFEENISELSKEMFLNEMTRKIFEVMQSNRCCDSIALHGWAPTLTEHILEAQEKAAFKSSAKPIVELMKDRYRRTLLRNAAQNFVADYENYDLTTDELRGKIVEVVDSTDKAALSKPEHIRDILPRVLSAINAAASGVVLGIPWPWPSLNERFGGMHKKTLITIAARPSMGKSAFVLQIARSVALSGKRIAVFSLEMSKEKCAGRMLFSQANKCFDSALRGKLQKAHFPDVSVAMDKIADLDVYIDDQGAQTTSQIRQKCRELHQKKPLDIIVVDHLGLVKAPEGSFSRNEEVTKISAGNLELCKMFDCPVIQLSQLNRQCELRPIPRPMLPDLRDSGTIEQDSDTVIFLYREGYYTSVEAVNPPNSVEIIFAKHRDGKLGTGLLHSNADTMVFSEIDNIHKEAPWPQSTGGDYVK